MPFRSQRKPLGSEFQNILLNQYDKSTPMEANTYALIRTIRQFAVFALNILDFDSVIHLQTLSLCDAGKWSTFSPSTCVLIRPHPNPSPSGRGARRDFI